jgi:hypothetical protein
MKAVVVGTAIPSNEPVQRVKRLKRGSAKRAPKRCVQGERAA